MRRRLSKTAAGLGLALIVTAVGGCGSGGGTSEVGGSTLTIYAGLALRGADGEQGQQVQNAMKLALADSGGEVGGRRVEALYLDDTSGESPRWDQARTAENARRASQDSTAIGYLGDLSSGATRVSLPITNQAEMGQISPTATGVDLTRAAGGETPDRLQPSGKRTFARVVPGDDVQAQAAAVWAKKLGARSVAAVDDGSAFGHVLTVAFEDAARNQGLDVVSGSEDKGAPKTSPDLVYAGGAGPKGLRALETAGRLSPGAKLMASDAMLDPAVLPQLGALESRLYITSPFIDPSELPPEGERFATDYKSRFGEEPGPAAAYGYESMALFLDAIDRAGSSGDDRLKVIDSLLGTRDRQSVLGTYSIDEFGDTTLRKVSGERVRGGEPVFDTTLEAPR
jgi:branched-chain amino acid transport system substrate-binding protein